MNTESESTSERSAMAVAAFVLGLIYLSLRKTGRIGDSDLWWHLSSGDLIRSDGAVPTTDPFSWTAAGEAWQPNAWLSDVLFSWLRDIAGLTAFSIYRALGVAILGILLWLGVRRRMAGSWSAAAAAFLAVFLMMPFITERPQVLGFVVFGGLMLILPRALSGSSRATIGLAALLALWTNLHGSFIIGVGVIGLVSLGKATTTREWRQPSLIAAIALLAPLLNPYGWNAYRQAFSIPGVSSFIEEWRPLDPSDGRDQLILLFVIVSLLGVVQARRWRSWEVSLPLVALLVLTARAIRTAPFLLMWAAPLFASGVSSLAFPSLRDWARARTQPLGVGLLLAGMILIGSVAPSVSDAGEVDPSVAPLQSTDALPAGCRLLNEYEFGGLVINRRWPEIQVSQDGRNDLYGLDRIELQESWFESNDLRFLSENGITCVLARPDRPIADALRSEPSWTIRSESNIAVAFAVRE